MSEAQVRTPKRSEAHGVSERASEPWAQVRTPKRSEAHG
jgi:hypothetical protein